MEMRSKYFDLWKGLSISVVIFIHALSDAGSFEPWSAEWIFSVVFRQIVNFAVPIFLGLAGYFVVTSISSISEFYKNRFSRILPSYLAWTFLFVLLSRPGHFTSGVALGRDVLLGDGIGIGYFVIVLSQYILLTPFLLRVRSESIHIVLIGLGYIFSCGFSYAVRLGWPGAWGLGPGAWVSQFPYYAIPFFAWAPFYHLGLYLARCVKAPALQTIPLGFLTAFMFCVSIAESLYWAAVGEYGFASSQIKASTFAASLLLLLYIVKNSDGEYKGGRLVSSLVGIGRLSYPVYLIHFPVMVLVQRVLMRVFAVHEHAFVYVLASVLLVVCICLGVIFSIKAIQRHSRFRWLSVLVT